MSEKALYSEHLEAIIALISYLGMTGDYKSRTPTYMANDLSLNPSEVETVLKNFKGLFRESKKPGEDTGEYYYTLQIRYALWGMGDQPLDADYMGNLFRFVSDMVANEEAAKRQSSANRVAVIGAMIASIAALVASIISLIIALS